MSSHCEFWMHLWASHGGADHRDVHHNKGMLQSSFVSTSLVTSLRGDLVSRELQEVAAPGGGLAVTLFLSLAFVFRDVDVSSANVFDLPYNVRVHMRS
jgi:hypothetical protein